MHPRGRRAALRVAAAVVAALLASCTDAAHDIPRAGPAQGDAPAVDAPDADDAAVAEYVTGMRAWVACMRAHGLGLPDPGPNGEVALPAGRWWKTDPEVVAAQEDCAPLHPEVPDVLVAALQPERTPQEIATARAYAACMQASGAPDFPDVGPDGYPQRTRAGDPAWDPLAPGARNATRTCAHIIGDPAVPGPGRG